MSPNVAIYLWGANCSLLRTTSPASHKCWVASVMSDSLQPHGLQHTRLPCPSQLPEFVQTHVHWLSDAIQASHPVLPPAPPVLSLSQDQGLFNESGLLIRWPKYWSFNFSASVLPMNWFRKLISFRFDWFDLLAVQGTLKSLLQHHSSKLSILQYWTFFMI